MALTGSERGALCSPAHCPSEVYLTPLRGNGRFPASMTYGAFPQAKLLKKANENEIRFHLWDDDNGFHLPRPAPAIPRRCPVTNAGYSKLNRMSSLRVLTPITSTYVNLAPLPLLCVSVIISTIAPVGGPGGRIYTPKPTTTGDPAAPHPFEFSQDLGRRL